MKSDEPTSLSPKKPMVPLSGAALRCHINCLIDASQVEHLHLQMEGSDLVQGALDDMFDVAYKLLSPCSTPPLNHSNAVKFVICLSVSAACVYNQVF